MEIEEEWKGRGKRQEAGWGDLGSEEGGETHGQFIKLMKIMLLKLNKT